MLSEMGVTERRNKMDKMTVTELREARLAAIRAGYDHCSVIIGHYLVLSGRDKNANRPDYPAHCELTRADDRRVAILCVVTCVPPLLLAAVIMVMAIVKVITG